jgi:anti-sigma B factor antagonist
LAKKKNNIFIQGKEFVVLELAKEDLELVNSNDLKALINEQLEKKIKAIAFDLKNVKTVNSSGLGILISCLKTVKDIKGTFKLINVNEKIKKIFIITKLNLVFELD